MLDTRLVLWLQQWASPALTEIMRAVSLWGYVRSCLAGRSRKFFSHGCA